MRLTKKEQEQIKSEVNEHVLQNALDQRKSWRDKYKLDERQLYNLFSEFSSMMQISRQQQVENAPCSVKNKLAQANKKTGEVDAMISKLFPMGADVSSNKYNLMRLEEAHKHHRLSKNDYKDFRVPVQVCIDFSEVLRPTKLRLRAIVMSALGIQASYSKAKVTYEQFLHINSFLRYNNGSHDDFIWFCVKLFDPSLTGFTSTSDCEAIVDLLFDNKDEEGQTSSTQASKEEGVKTVEIRSRAENASSAGDDTSVGKAWNDSEDPGQDEAEVCTIENRDAMRAKQRAKAAAEGKDESVAANIKRVCRERGIFRPEGFLDFNLLYRAFADGLLDVEDFKSALK